MAGRYVSIVAENFLDRKIVMEREVKLNSSQCSGKE
jgi:hypothetical protein